MAHKDPEVRAAYHREWRENNREERRAYMREWRLTPAGRENEVRRNERRRLRRATDPAFSESYRDQKFRLRYGLSLAEYDTLLAGQGGRCAVCGTQGGEDKSSRLHVDHNHTTGVVRALLCGGCNHALGFLCEDPARVEALARYAWKWAYA